MAIVSSFERISKFLTSRDPSGFKLGPQSFTRGGPLSPELLITLLLYLVADGGRRGYGHLLQAFWDDAHSHGVGLPTDTPISSAAFCNARRKLRSSAVRVLLHDAAAAFDRQHGARLRFRGRRVLAVDGSKMAVQRAPELWQEFGGPSAGYTPQILVTTLLDVMAKIPVDACVAPFASSEREQLGRLLDHLRPGNILLLDRGYPSYEIIALLLSRGIDFVLRVPSSSGFPAVDDFVRSGRVDADIVLTPSRRSTVADLRPFKLRAVLRKTENGEPQVFLTSLQRSTFPSQDIQQLYRLRWEIELLFRVEKGDYLGQAQFHARNADGVRQEVFALLLFIALSRTLMAAAAQTHAVPYQCISQKGALLAAASRFTLLLVQQDPQRARAILAGLLARIARCLDRQRRPRSFPRRSYKPRPRWGPQGHLRDPERQAQVG